MKPEFTPTRCVAQPRLLGDLARRERGATLLEVLVAIVVLALGLLGIMGVQMRTLADTQTSVRRAQAIRLIEDLSERVRLNPNSLDSTVLNNYVVAAGAAPAVPACNPCAPADLAKQQISQWKTSVTNNLPSGDATTFLLEDEAGAAGQRRQLGVLMSWRENERSAATDYNNVFTTSSTSGTVQCPAQKTCHLQFIALGARCTPDVLAGPGTWFCAGGLVKP